MAVATEERTSEERICETSWDGDVNRFNDEQYECSCVLDRAICGGDWAEKPVKERCLLPIREPEGELSREAVHIAAAQLEKLEGVTPKARVEAQSVLREAFKALGEDVPEDLERKSAADELMSQFAVTPGEARRSVTALRAMGSEEFKFRADSSDGHIGTLSGHFAVFHQWTEIRSVFEGHFMERFMPGAFTKTMQENGRGVRCLFQHGKDPQVGMKPLGPIRSMGEDEHGANYEVGLLDTSYNRDLLPGLKGGLYGASFRFGVMREEVNPYPAASADNPNGIEERTVVECRLREFGPCTFGQYADATASARGYTDEFLLEVQGEVQRDLLVARAIERFRELHGGVEISSAGTSESSSTEETEVTTQERSAPPAEGAVPAVAPDEGLGRVDTDRLRTTRLPGSAHPLRTNDQQEPVWKL